MKRAICIKNGGATGKAFVIARNSVCATTMQDRCDAGRRSLHDNEGCEGGARYDTGNALCAAGISERAATAYETRDPLIFPYKLQYARPYLGVLERAAGLIVRFDRRGKI